MSRKKLLNYYRLKAVGCGSGCKPAEDYVMSRSDLELIVSLRLLFLGLNILHDHLIGHIARTSHKVPSSPDMTSPILLPYVWKLHQDLPRCLSFDILHQLTCRKTRGHRHKQMYMIPRYMPFQDLNIVRQTDLSHQLSDSKSYFLNQYRSTVFRYPDEMQLDIIPGMRRGSIELHAPNYTKVIA